MVFVSVVTEFPISLDEEITDEMVDSGRGWKWKDSGLATLVMVFVSLVTEFPISDEELTGEMVDSGRGWKWKDSRLAEWPELKFDHHPQHLDIQQSPNWMLMEI